jgi:hypothetical protein
MLRVTMRHEQPHRFIRVGRNPIDMFNQFDQQPIAFLCLRHHETIDVRVDTHRE